MHSFRIIVALLLLLMGSTCLASPSDFKDMVLIPAGSFRMGFNIENDMEWGDEDEEPVHEVELSAYWIDRYEVNAAEFSRFLNEHLEESAKYIEMGTAVTIEKKNGNYQPRDGLDRYPANRISWYGADAFCRSHGKRLPTEAEWEKAARGTDERIFPWGNEFPNNDWVTFRLKFSEHGFKAMAPVDSMERGRSPYGVHHMAGNVWEWVADWYADDYYQISPHQDPQGPEEGSSKVLRGGNWYYKAYYMRSVYRFNESPGIFKVWQGFRCARSEAPKK